MAPEYKITLDDYAVQKKLFAGKIKLAVETAMEDFQNNTGYCPGKISIEMIDVTKQLPVPGSRAWQVRKHFIVGEIHIFVEI